MIFKQFEIWLADLNPRIGTETGKIRPVLIVQTNLLNQIPHPSTIVCPITTHVVAGSHFLRVHITNGMAHLHQDCDIMIDHLRAIDNKRLIRKIGILPPHLVQQTKDNISVVFDFEG
jgi:mRNA interferase MazF